jgi:CheY-like chemotaxis protein
MMNVLIIEDDFNKISQLSTFVRGELPDANILERRSYQSGLKEAVGSLPDIIILDMSLPTYEVGGSEPGGRMRAFAGREILSQLKRRGVSTKVVIVTQFERFGEEGGVMTLDELKNDMKINFGGNYMGTVFYQPAESGWRNDLREALRSFLT